MQIVARAFDDKKQLLPHVTVLAGALAVLEELHIGFDAALARVHFLVARDA